MNSSHKAQGIFLSTRYRLLASIFLAGLLAGWSSAGSGPPGAAAPKARQELEQMERGPKGFRPTGLAPRRYKPDELIVKFRHPGAERLPDLTLAGQVVDPALLPDSVQRLGRRFEAKKTERLFKQFRSAQARNQAILHKGVQIQTANEQKLAQRLRRAPQGMAAPKMDRIFKITVSPRPGESFEAILAAYQNDPNVEYAEPNYAISLAATPNDPLFGNQWALNNTGQSYPSSGQYGLPPGKVDADLDGPEAWKITTGGTGVVVAVADTGVDYRHPDLAGNMWVNKAELNGQPGVDDDGNGFVDDLYGYDFCQAGQARDSDPIDDNGHGTHCAGIIAAEGNNGLAIAGVCWRGRIMAVRCIAADGAGYESDALDAWSYAIENGADIISNSWADEWYSETTRDAVRYAASQGVVLVAAAGNDHSVNRKYPAGYDQVIAVAASDARDKVASFSDYGWWVDVLAPGVDILSLRAGGTAAGLVYDEATTVMSGTSMACPFAAGVAALILGQHPTFTPEEVRSVLKMSAEPVLALDGYAGQGRINARKALNVTARPPIAILDMSGYRADDGLISGTIPITGSARGGGFSSYQLFYGAGWSPTAWTSIYKGTTPVTSGTLVGAFNTAPLGSGYYTIKLVVRDIVGSKVETSQLIQLEIFDPLFPLNNDVLRPGGVLEIKARIKVPLEGFKVEHGAGFNPQTWSADGITTCDGTQSAVWAKWDTSAITAKGFYCLKFTLRTPSGPFEEYVDMIYFDPQLKQGWPVYLPYEGEYQPYENFQDVTIADLNGDGQKQVLTVQSANYEHIAQLNAYDQRGRLLWSRPGTLGYPLVDIPTAGDLNGDGLLETIVSLGCGGAPSDADTNMYIYRPDGSPLSEYWPRKLGAAFLPNLIADLTHDGRRELVAKGAGLFQGQWQGKILILDEQGNHKGELKIPELERMGAYPSVYPAVGNFDEDKDLEIVTRYGDAQVAVFNTDGSLLPGWPADAGGNAIKESLVVGDVNRDGFDEVVVIPWDTPAIYLLDHTGKCLPGWPVFIAYADFYSFAEASLGDLDGDGDLEICVGAGRTIYVFHHTGKLAAGWPRTINDSAFVYRSCSIGDINGDGKPDLVAAAGGIQPVVLSNGALGSSGGVWAWNGDGTPIDLNPDPATNALLMELGSHISAWKAPVSIVDLDGDGKVELVASAVHESAIGNWRTRFKLKNRHALYAWDLEAPYKAATMQWPVFQHDPQHTGRYQPPRPDNGARGGWQQYR